MSKDASGYAASRGYADGHQRICRACMRIRNIDWRKRGGLAKENARPATKARKARYAASAKGQASRNKPANRAAAVIRAAAWAKANPWKTSAHQRNTYARANGGIGTITADELKDLFESYAGLCVYCNRKANATDHVIALARGGSHSIANLVPACKACNSSKKSTPLLVWLSQRAA